MSGRFTLDYLLDIIHEVHRRQYVAAVQFSNYTETQRVLSGLLRIGIVKKCQVVPKCIRYLTWSGLGRPPTIYTLAIPYESIRLGDVASLVPGMSAFRQRLCQLGHDIFLYRLAKTPVLDVNDILAFYSPEILLCGLSCLSVTAYRRHGTFCSGSTDTSDFYCGDRQWASDMTAIGIVKNKYGLGYKLVKPLAQVKIGIIFPYLCYRSPRKLTYNRLFYLLKQKPVSVLLPPYDGIS